MYECDDKYNHSLILINHINIFQQFGGSEAIITGLSDEFPIIKRNREVFVAILFTLYFIVGLASCAQGGVYVVELLDRYAASYSILFAVLCETIAVSWIYGLKRFSADIKSMLGFDPGWWWKFCWLLCAPIFLMVIIGYGLYEYKPLTYGTYEYPTWANVLGLMIAGSSVSCIPIGAIIQFTRAPGDTYKDKLIHILTPIPPVFIATNDVNQLLAAAAAASNIAASSNINFTLDNKQCNKVTRNRTSINDINHTLSRSDSCNSDESNVPLRHCGGRISVNCLHTDTQSIDHDDTEIKDTNDCNDVNSEIKLKVTCKRDQHQQQTTIHSTTIMINPSISFDSTQV